MNVAAAKLARSEVKVENGAGYMRTGYHQRLRIRLERLLSIRERLVTSRYVPFVIGACINAAIFITLYVWLSSCSEAAVSSHPSNHTESASSWCGQDWVAHGDKCSKLLGSQAFDAAKGDCERINGTLASIHNTAQNRFLTKYVRGEHGEEAKFYIGLQRSGSNNFAWLDGSAYDFQAWQPDEPNNPREGCVEVSASFGTRNGRWNDVTCNSRLYALCSRNVQGF